MIRFYRLKFLSILFLSFIVSVELYAASGTPSSYKPTVTKVELCSSSSCSDPIVLGSSSKEFDIASVTAGADVGNYLSDFSITLGRTYTHVRSTISSTFKVTGTVDVSGETCNTVASPTVAASNATTTAKTATDGTLAEMTWIIPDTNGGGDYGDLTSTFASNGTSKTDGASTFTFTIALSVPYTPKATDVPTVRMSFDVTNTLTATESGGTCVMYLEPPVQNVTITGR
tara:strand:+ start:896 stop:1582 length:687 start_codon:yes stop_codon:yes gene_type:complete